MNWEVWTMPRKTSCCNGTLLRSDVRKMTLRLREQARRFSLCAGVADDPAHPPAADSPGLPAFPV